MRIIPFLIILISCFNFASAQVIEESHHYTVGYIHNNGTIEDSHHSTIGYIKNDGTVEDSHHSTIGYAKGINKQWAAVFFFFHFY